MQIKIEIDAACSEPEITIRTSEMTDAIRDMLQTISVSHQTVLAGFTGDTVQLIDTADVIRFYSASKKVFAQTEAGEAVIRLRLYELEERLDGGRFVRISNSEIVNVKAIQSMDLSFAGTISITFSNGSTAYVSRRYVSKIKQAFGI